VTGRRTNRPISQKEAFPLVKYIERYL